jgi:ketosteroid isomerase-like protein
MSAEDEVRKASEKFYAGLTRMLNGDAAALVEIWSHSDTVTIMRPVGGRDVGWDEVRESFGRLASVASEGQVTLENQMIQVAGDMAYELGIERGQFKLAGTSVTIENRVTDIYRREAGEWRIVHHHADVSPAMVDVLRKLRAEK